MQDLLNLTSFQYWNFTERQHSFQEVEILIPPTWNFSSCLPERSLKTGRLAELDILPPSSGFTNNYDSEVNPSIINSFATAAYRFGHSLIQGSLE